MEYERIHKVQLGVLSPTKLRMKILGAQKGIRKGGSNSSRTSPSKVEESECAKNSLLDVDHQEASYKDNEGDSDSAGKEVSKFRQSQSQSSEKKADTSHAKQNISRNFPYQSHSASNLSMIHPIRSVDEGTNFHDTANTSTSFDFHQGMRATQQALLGPLSRQVPSKWNDAEKWIANRQITNASAMKKNVEVNQGGNRSIASAWPTIGPELLAADRNRNNFTHPASENGTEKFSFVSSNSGHRECNFSSLAGSSGSLLRNDKELNHQESLLIERLVKETTGPTAAPTEQSVTMRDIGTEMTPIPSPLDSLTPTRSPMSSMPSTPTRGASALLTAEAAPSNSDTKPEGGAGELSERELQLRTRREIASLGIQLGKTNIASWASKEDIAQSSSPKTLDIDHKKIEYETRAAAWEEAENCKHHARFRREEVRIQAWESHKKAKIQAEMKKIEAKAETMKAQAAKKASEKLSTIQQQVEEREAAAHAQMMKHADRVARKADNIRRTGRLPSSSCSYCFMFL